MEINVGLYIPVYNGERFIRNCLEGVLRQTYPIERIVVVDDGSTDHSVEIAENLGVEVLRQPSNMGLSKARRRAFEELKTTLIASLDVDCVPEPDWLERLISALNRHENAAGVGGKLIEFYNQKLADRWRAVHMPQHWGDEIQINPLFLFGCNNVFKRDAILKIGNYPTDELYRTNAEDYYISQKLKSAGFKLVYTPDAIAYHYRKDTIPSVLKTYWRWFFPNQPKPESWIGLWKKIKEVIFYSEKMIRRDLTSGDMSLLMISLFNVFYQSQLDLDYFLEKQLSHFRKDMNESIQR